MILKSRKDLRFVPLVELPPYALVSDTHPLAQRTSVSVSALRTIRWCLLDLPLSSDYFLSFFTAAGLKPKIAERTRDMAVMRSLVGNGFGYAIANVRPLSDVSPDGNKLQFIPLIGQVRSMQMGLLMAEGAQNVLTVKAFIDHCRETITNDVVPGMNVPEHMPKAQQSIGD